MASKIYLSEFSVEKAAPAPAETNWRASVLLNTAAVRSFIADTFTCSAVMFLALSVQHGQSKYFASFDQRTWLFSTAAGLCATLLLRYNDHAGAPTRTPSLDRTADSVRTCMLTLLFLLPGSFLLRSDFPEIAVVMGLAILPIPLAVQRHLLREPLPSRCSTNQGESEISRQHERDVEEFLLVSSQQAMDHQHWQQGRCDFYTIFGKRLFDLGISSVLIVLLSPVLLLIATIIRLSSKGPALFVQDRVGVGGELFRMYKFRSMAYDADTYQRSPKSSSDPRITFAGRILRRTGLDELPQLFNVLRGDMSLVGPRPEMPFIVDGYNDVQRLRLCALPGITGFWQLSTDRAFPIHENLHHDLSYICRRSFFLDMAILIHTLLFAMRRGI